MVHIVAKNGCYLVEVEVVAKSPSVISELLRVVMPEAVLGSLLWAGFAVAGH